MVARQIFFQTLALMLNTGLKIEWLIFYTFEKEYVGRCFLLVLLLLGIVMRHSVQRFHSSNLEMQINNNVKKDKHLEKNKALRVRLC